MIFEKARRVAVLCFIWEKEVTTFIDIHNHVGGSMTTIGEALRELEEAGLIKRRVSSRTKVIWLTDKGKKVAEKMGEVIRELEVS